MEILFFSSVRKDRKFLYHTYSLYFKLCVNINMCVQMYVCVCKLVVFLPLSGDQYWVFKDRTALPDYPRPLADWGMQNMAGHLPTKLEAAFVWAHNGKTYLFSGGEFWRFDERGTGMRQEVGYPRSASLWTGVPADPDDIISWGDGKTASMGSEVLYAGEGGAGGGSGNEKMCTTKESLRDRLPEAGIDIMLNSLLSFSHPMMFSIVF